MSNDWRFNRLLVMHPRERLWARKRIENDEPLYGPRVFFSVRSRVEDPAGGAWQAREVAPPQDADALAFKLLGLDQGKASEADVKTAFKTLAFVHHPDRGGDVAKFHDAKAAMERAIKVIKARPT